jgi:hypothetical protein
MGRRPSWAYIGLCLLAFSGAVVTCWANSMLKDTSNAQPRAHISCALQDFGTIGQGSLLRARFPISNTGDRRLIVTEKAEGCCGDSSSARSIVVEPGDTHILNITIDTELWCGQIEHEKRYATNDPKRSQFTLTVRGKVDSKNRASKARLSERFEQVREVGHS